MNTSRRATDNSQQLAQILASDLSMEIFNYLDSDPRKLNLAAVNTSCNGLFKEKNLIVSLLLFIVHGNEGKAAHLLTQLPRLSLERGDITDYSGRTFKNITAYEYAYWARDWHMLDMLETHMSPEQKTLMLQKIDAIEQHGLTYTTQNGETKTSKHFSLQPLIDAYNADLAVYARWSAHPRTASYDDLQRAWLDVGLEQRNLPAYVIQEYCRHDRSFHPRPEFSESDLPRSFNVYKFWSDIRVSCFPLDRTPDFHLGSHFSLLRAGGRAAGGAVAGGACGMGGGGDGGGRGAAARMVSLDLMAVCHLDVVSNAKVTQSRCQWPIELSH